MPKETINKMRVFWKGVKKVEGFLLNFFRLELRVPSLRSAFQKLASIRHKGSIGTPFFDPINFTDPLQQGSLGNGIQYRDTLYITHTDLPVRASAVKTFSDQQKIILIIAIALLILALWTQWHTTLIVFVIVLTSLYLIDLIFNLFLVVQSFKQQPEIQVTQEQVRSLQDTELPIYTILCPLYKEWRVVAQFISAIERLDWPKEKLDVQLLLEEDDRETIEEIAKMKLPSFFRTIIVPQSQPKTKPKACNYGLHHARGTYVVIYDAEDMPEPDQLKKAYIVFQNNTDKKIICAQAKLNFYNARQNILTRLFTTEYSLWFDLILTGLQCTDCPIPLGGTSNHFPLQQLRALQGWDPFNVTEDCDLGIRIAKEGYSTVIFNSITFEEANSELGNWMRQRSRWIKGYMQTYLVHMRSLTGFSTDLRLRHFLAIQLIVGGKVLSLFVNPFFWILTLSYFILRPYVGPTIESFYPAPVLYIGVFSLVFGNFLYLYYYVLGCLRRDQCDLVKYATLIPFYWLLMSIAAWKALYQLIVKPHYWEKTIHGLHLSHKPSDSTPTYETTHD